MTRLNSTVATRQENKVGRVAVGSVQEPMNRKPAPMQKPLQKWKKCQSCLSCWLRVCRPDDKQINAPMQKWICRWLCNRKRLKKHYKRRKRRWDGGAGRQLEGLHNPLCRKLFFSTSNSDFYQLPLLVGVLHLNFLLWITYRLFKNNLQLFVSVWHLQGELEMNLWMPWVWWARKADALTWQ